MTLARLGLCVGLAAALVGAAAGVPAQGRQVPRIGLLAPNRCDHPNYQALRRGFRDLRYVEGETFTIACREAGGRDDRLPALARELARLAVDVLVTDGTAATRAALHATKTIPIVMGTVGDPVGSGFVPSLARPGGHVTGLTLMTAELNVKRLELLREMVPAKSRVAVLANSVNPTVTRALAELHGAARRLAVTLHVVRVAGAGELAGAFAGLVRDGAAAILVLPDPVLFGALARVTRLANMTRLPAVYEARQFVEAGGLMAYGPDIPANFHRAATYVDKILKGARPAELPIEQPTKFELVVNLRTARALGLAVPPSVLLRADEVLE